MADDKLPYGFLDVDEVSSEGGSDPEWEDLPIALIHELNYEPGDDDDIPEQWDPEWVPVPFFPEWDPEVQYSSDSSSTDSDEDESEEYSTTYEKIPTGTPFEEAMDKLRFLLKEGKLGGICFILFSSSVSLCVMEIPFFEGIVKKWNHIVEMVALLGNENMAEMSLQKREDENYIFKIDVFINSAWVDFGLSWLLDSSEALNEALQILYHTGQVYDGNQQTVFDNCNIVLLNCQNLDN